MQLQLRVPQQICVEGSGLLYEQKPPGAQTRGSEEQSAPSLGPPLQTLPGSHSSLGSVIPSPQRQAVQSERQAGLFFASHRSTGQSIRQSPQTIFWHLLLHVCDK